MRHYLIALIILVSCKNGIDSHQKNNVESGSKKLENSIATSEGENSMITEIVCDTIYKNKEYKITLILFDTTNVDETVPNTLFIFSKLTNGRYLPLFSDSIFNTIREIQFTDYNNDNIKDILIQNISDVRSNWTYYLYFVDTAQNKLKQVKGFEEIKNPHYITQHDLIDNYVVSGQNWTSFYKIQGDSVKDFDIVIYDKLTNDGRYEQDYKKALNSILLIEKNNQRP